jgi:hypothetical protein
VPNPYASNAVAADITVRDLTTGGATMTSALDYAAPQLTLTLISAPSGQLFATTSTSTPFTVKVLQQDGTTPIPNTTATFSVTTGQTRFEACGFSTCTLSTDASGPASSAIGSVTASHHPYPDHHRPQPRALPRSRRTTPSPRCRRTSHSTGLAWPSTTPAICAIFTATEVGPCQWQLEIVSGTGQSVNASDTLPTHPIRRPRTHTHRRRHQNLELPLHNPPKSTPDLSFK